MVALVGPNGSGKTSLLNCISGLNRDYSGSIQLWQDDLKIQKQRQVASRLAYLHQHMPEQLKLSVQQVVELGLIPKLKPWSVIGNAHIKAIHQAIERVGLTDMIERPFNSLSGGEKQRALIAKTILQQPDILLMDEPTNHLDIKHQINILSLVRSLELSTVTCIHDVNLALAVSDEIICLVDGRLAFHKALNDIEAEDFSLVYGVECRLDREPFNDHPRLSVRWS